jgi:predicted nucleotide-binding protein
MTTKATPINLQKSPAPLGSPGTLKAIAKLERRVRELQEIDISAVDDFWARARSTIAKIDSTMSEIFGADSAEFKRVSMAATSFRPHISPRTTRRDEIAAFSKGVKRAISLLQTELEILRERVEDASEGEGSAAATSRDTERQFSKDEVFIVHGQDDAAKQEVARFIQACGLTPRILHELDNQGDTIIEKFERHTANIGFAIVLLTPDDLGGPKGGEMKPRARQNVVAELFFFAGKIGRKRVVALKKGGIEIPSDMAGVVYVDMDRRGAWKQDLVRELKAAEFEGDWSKAMFG